MGRTGRPHPCTTVQNPCCAVSSATNPPKRSSRSLEALAAWRLRLNSTCPTPRRPSNVCFEAPCRDCRATVGFPELPGDATCPACGLRLYVNANKAIGPLPGRRLDTRRNPRSQVAATPGSPPPGASRDGLSAAKRAGRGDRRPG